MVTLNNTGVFQGVQRYGNLKGEAMDYEMDVVGNVQFDQGMEVVIVPSSTGTFGRKFRIYGVFISLRTIAANTTTSYGIVIYKNVYKASTGQIAFLLSMVPLVAQAKDLFIALPYPIDVEADTEMVMTGDNNPAYAYGSLFGHFID